MLTGLDEYEDKKYLLTRIANLEEKIYLEKQRSKKKVDDFQTLIQKELNNLIQSLEEVENTDDLYRVRQQIISFQLAMDESIERQKEDNFRDLIQDGNFFSSFHLKKEQLKRKKNSDFLDFYQKIRKEKKLPKVFLVSQSHTTCCFSS